MVAAPDVGRRRQSENLVGNAIDAMGESGTLTVTSAATDDAVELSVADTGVGMDPEQASRIFEPFFTTKGPKTRGLGLAVNHGIVTRHRGTLTIDSLEGLGTTAVVSLPVADAPGV